MLYSFTLYFIWGVLLVIGFVLLVLACVTVAGKLKVFAQNFHHTVKCLEDFALEVLCLDEGALGLQPLGLNETGDPLIFPITVIIERNKFSTECSPKGAIQEKSGDSELDNSTDKLLLRGVREKEKINPNWVTGFIDGALVI
jgi:hypothetical protein